ncbi:hypothetical protein DJ568_15405 [Mucilaginibacter hurinus]|uniref:Uncharacterized protein n=1 Tax=Mucilaginibacter hurinus TaxID=2201324 RepID=A0A367GKB5_9SPHI|nr:hypothetical protein [Mucilaginibacter hurinus]RCH53924.1 hypothetical protein DJ568_15405 [Mucilaginibacter hurinus]
MGEASPMSVSVKRRACAALSNGEGTQCIAIGGTVDGVRPSTPHPSSVSEIRSALLFAAPLIG